MKKLIELDLHTFKQLKRLTDLAETKDFPLNVDTGMLSNVPWWNTANLSDFTRIEFDLSPLKKALDKAV